MYENKSCQEVLTELETNFNNGLSEEEVLKRRQKYGLNKLTEKKKKSWIRIFLGEMNDPMIYILFAAAIISFVVSFYNPTTNVWSVATIDYADPIVILIVVIMNATIGTIQEIKAEKSLDALKKLAAPTAIVRRNGDIKTIPAEEVVPGDILILEEGNQIPADCRLITSVNLKADESSLTGESVPVEKDAKVVLSEEVGIGDRVNLAYMSTPIAYGHGEAVAISTGMNTEIGRIATMLTSNEDESTPLQKKLASLSKLLGFITIGLVILFFIIAILQAYLQSKNMLTSVITMFITAISLAVAAVPEGLPAVVTIVLSLGVQRMVKANTIVRKLPSVETLGAVTVVCSDKTGTLTQNKMTVVEAYADGRKVSKTFFNENKDVLEYLANGLCLCSNASIEHDKSYGDPTEIALVEFANLYGNKKSALEHKTPRLNELPFDSVRKMMSTQHSISDKEFLNYTKGAMDQILKHTTSIYKKGKIVPITNKDVEDINRAAAEMSAKALRVLALAFSSSKVLKEEDLVFYGLVGMVDPPREEAKPAIIAFKNASIKTVMITGDHKDTAFAIAKELGIVESLSQCMSGDEINSLSFDELREKVKTTRVYARVSPENKVSIVKAFKANGNIVAMTGDGVNDAPSLKSADIGIAMGITGTDVAKGAADMVLSDDNFASIEKAVEEGRGIYENIKKTILFLLSSNIGEVICMVVAVCLGLPSPLAAIHILFVNLITDSLPAIALGSDRKDPDIMKQKPRDPKEGLFANGGYFTLFFYGTIIGLITLLAFLFYPVQRVGFDLNAIISILNSDPVLLRESETCAFVVLGLSELFHMLNMSNIKKSAFRVFKGRNYLFLVSFIFAFIFPVLLTEVDAFNEIFNCTHLDWRQWIDLVLVSMIPLIIHEIIIFFKWLYNRSKKVGSKKVDETTFRNIVKEELNRKGE